MKEDEKKLLSYFRQLSEQDSTTLLRFAEFMAHNGTQIQQSSTSTEPLHIERPENETVVAAIKRLSATYPMLEKDRLLNETSSLMAAHMLQGREAKAVIDELETLFRDTYDKDRQGE